MRVEKKVRTEAFSLILSGNKKFDLRLADFLVNPGDTLVLREWDADAQEYTGQVIEKTVTQVLRTKELDYWPEEDVEKYGYQIISFL